MQLLSRGERRFTMVEPNPGRCRGKKGLKGADELAEPPQLGGGEPAAPDVCRNPIPRGKEANREYLVTDIP